MLLKGVMNSNEEMFNELDTMYRSAYIASEVLREKYDKLREERDRLLHTYTYFGLLDIDKISNTQKKTLVSMTEEITELIKAFKYFSYRLEYLEELINVALYIKIKFILSPRYDE